MGGASGGMVDDIVVSVDKDGFGVPWSQGQSSPLWHRPVILSRQVSLSLDIGGVGAEVVEGVVEPPVECACSCPWEYGQLAPRLHLRFRLSRHNSSDMWLAVGFFSCSMGVDDDGTGSGLLTASTLGGATTGTVASNMLAISVFCASLID